VVPAACRGGVEVLFVARGQSVPGKLDETSGEAELHEAAQPGDEDLVNLAATHTLLHGGTVYGLPAGELPNGSPLAAIFWLPLARRAGKV
jgi:hypothetical protein